MSNVLYAALFATFVALVIAVRFTAMPHRRRMVSVLVVYVVAVHGLLSVTGRDAWPFVTHGVFLEDPDSRRPLSNLRFVAVDPSGDEHRIDPRAWAPIHDRTLAIWWLVNFDRLPPPERRAAMEFLLDKAEKQRGNGAPPALQIFRAPAWYSLELAPSPSPQPYVGFRAYLVTRTPARKRADGSESERVIAEFKR